MSENSKQVIVWAVDPFAENQGYHRSAAWAIHAIAGAVPSVVRPVHIHINRFSAFEMSGDRPADLASRIGTSAEAAMSEVLRRVEIKGLQPIEVLLAPGLSLRQGVEALLAHASKLGASLIVASTHGRKGLSRLLLGSFAEDLILKSTIPLLIVNPELERPANFLNILFPTDFSLESRDAFPQVVRLAKSLGSEITIFHKLVYIITPELEKAHSKFPDFWKDYEQELAARQKDGEVLAEQAREAGVAVRVVIDSKTMGIASEAILKEAESRPGLIALASQSGPISTMLVGSTTRNIVRSSPYPVWIIHEDRNFG